MLKELKFVQGGVAKKDLIPAMTHFAIENGTIRSYNGIIALCTPIPFDIDCKPKADTLIKAINLCNEVVSLSMTENGRLKVQSGKFKAFIDCIEGETPHSMPDGEFVEIDGEELLKGIKACIKFVGDDASRPWSNGLLFDKNSIFATNNVCLIQYWMGFSFPSRITIPEQALIEMIRINEPPIGAQINNLSITLHYEGGRWLRSQLLNNDEWPDVTHLLETKGELVEMNQELFLGLENLKPFLNKSGAVHFKKEKIQTDSDETEGAVYEIDGLNYNAIFNFGMLNLLKGSADMIDLNLYPKPCPFLGHRLRGVIIGMVMRNAK